MRSGEAAFSTIELIVAVAISLMLLAAGGAWLLAMQPGSLRAAVNDVDADFAAAQSIAGSSGNGATLVFSPRAGGASGFTLRVYSGRPTADNAVTPTNTMEVSSATTIAEAHFGSPPFAIFLNSAGYATGKAAYPQLDAQENPAFAVIAQQPACPAGGIVLTFTSPQGATATRTYACNAMVAGTAAASATPTPNPPRVSPTYLLAHDTTDAGPLRFKAAEYGYYHWYASTANGAPCQTIASDTGAAPATFASPWPYAAASPAAQGAAAPAPPALAPYTWPAGDPDDPPAWFQLEPVLHDGGICTLSVADDYGQSGAVTVQVMGDLTASTNALTMQVGKSAQTIDFAKTFDSEKLMLSAGGHCLGVVTATAASGSFPSSPSHTPATASVTVAPVSGGRCTLIVEDQYGEQIAIGVTVASSSFATWPASLVVGAGESPVGTTSGTLAFAGTSTDVAFLLDRLLGGGVARAAAYSGACYAQAFASGTSGAVDLSIPSSVASALGVSVTTDGCILNANGSAPYGESAPSTGTPTGVMIAYEPVGSGQTGNYSDQPIGCDLNFGSWNPATASGAQASLGAVGSLQGNCTVAFSNGTSTQTREPDSGAVAVSVLSAGCISGITCAVSLTGVANSYNETTHGTTTGYAGTGTMTFESTDGGSTWTLVYSAFTDSVGTVTYVNDAASASPVFQGTWSGDPDVASGGLDASSVLGTITWESTVPSYVSGRSW